MRRPGPIQAIILDWAGSAVDFGSRAPVAAFAAAFADAGVLVSVEAIRKPMGLEKRRHLIALLEDDAIRARWRSVHGTWPGERDIDALYDAFQTQLLPTDMRGDPVNGAKALPDFIRS